MSRVRPEGIDQFHERLEEFKHSRKASLSIRDVVAKSMKKIEEARKYGATWDDIAQSLSESFQAEQTGSVLVTGKTVQGYYSKILKERQREKESSGRASRHGKKKSATPKLELIEYEPEQSESVNEEDIITDSVGFDMQPKTEGSSLNGTNTSKKSRFNFNTVRPDS